MDQDSNLQAGLTGKIAEPPFDDTRADFILLSSDGVAFHVHSVLLSILSPFFEGLFSLPPSGQQESATKPLVELSEKSDDFRHFLSWCDTRCHERSTALEDLQIVLELSEKFATESVTKHVENYLKLSDYPKKEPFRIFAIAVRFRFESLADLSAKETLNTPLENRIAVPEMRNISAFSYQSLVSYYTRCIKAMQDLFDDLTWVRNQPAGSHFCFPCCDDEDAVLEDCEMEERQGDMWLLWWLKYMDSVGKILAQRPVSAAAKDPVILEAAHTANLDGSCPECRDIGMEKLRIFAAYFEQKINAKISEVGLELEY